ncbi:MAG: hypothetical protein PHT87_03945 [Bacteroidales bacterium]|nr:hypothetical protein [Bacteroidales bacterium]
MLIFRINIYYSADPTIDLSNHKEWKGSIYKLRIDPGDGPDPKNMKDGKILKEEYLLIEYIKFVP